MKEAMLYQKLPDGKVQCNLCAHRCTIADGSVGICHVRENMAGVLYTRVYGRTIARHVDPIEKKPLLHFHPGSTAYSVATPGCNFRCRWCQNADISQAPREEHFLLGEAIGPEQIVAAAQRAGCRSIAYTYTEPTIFFEYTYDTARAARDAGLANVYVTNGYMTGEMLEKMHPYLDAANVDLKGFRDQVYRRYAGARLQPVLDSLKTMKQLGIWFEVTTLVIPGVNDGSQELQEAARFIAGELGPETPWHISRFTPTYQMVDVPPTAVSTLLRAQEIGRKAGLRYVYVGNVPGEANTICHVCGQLLIRRRVYQMVTNYITPDGRCPECGTPVAGREMAGAAVG
ncbi:MAG: AmmeMemoRadiSam system radical SAM enzyme [Anaerolineae bacterium]|jgi:pyruvate formate lyase activating enzyme